MSAVLSKPLSTTEAALALGVSERTLRRWRAQGQGPDVLVLAPSLIRYTAEALEEFRRHNTHRMVPAPMVPLVSRRRVSRERLGRHRTMADSIHAVEGVGKIHGEQGRP